jgi:hypothetical protein
LPGGELRPLHSQRVALIQLPDDIDLTGWWHTCMEMDAQTAYDLSGLLDPGQRMVTIMTYPQLIDVDNVLWVYLAWRGVLRWRHQAAEVEKLKREDLRTMIPQWLPFMYIGRKYQWVRAEPHYVPPVSLPFRLIGVIKHYGLVDATPGKEGEPPKWF